MRLDDRSESESETARTLLNISADLIDLAQSSNDMTLMIMMTVSKADMAVVFKASSPATVGTFQ